MVEQMTLQELVTRRLRDYGYRDARDLADIIGVHVDYAEWSEALEEYRDGRPMGWRVCLESGDVCMGESCSEWVDGGCELDEMAHKPEGIAVELVDGVIRILDLMAAKDMDFAQVGYVYGVKRTLPQLVAVLHYATAMSGPEDDDAASWLNGCIEAVREWLEDHGVDMDEILRLKHEYNKTRPYRHGGKRC